MSRIIAKPFDKAKKIIRSIFNGSPNLLTTSDINRQFEALKYQVDLLDKRVGVTSDLTFEVLEGDVGIIELKANCTYLEVMGCDFGAAPLHVSITMPIGETLDLCLEAEKEIVTYATDAGRKISGAFFEDNTSRAAADNILYKNPQWSYRRNKEYSPNHIVVVATITRVDTDNYVINSAALPREKALALGGGNAIQHLPNVTPEQLKIGDTYDKAFSILSGAKLPAISGELKSALTGGVETTTGRFKILNGKLRLSLNVAMVKHTNPTRYAESVFEIGRLVLTDEERDILVNTLDTAYPGATFLPYSGESKSTCKYIPLGGSIPINNTSCAAVGDIALGWKGDFVSVIVWFPMAYSRSSILDDAWISGPVSDFVLMQDSILLLNLKAGSYCVDLT